MKVQTHPDTVDEEAAQVEDQAEAPGDVCRYETGGKDREWHESRGAELRRTEAVLRHPHATAHLAPLDHHAVGQPARQWRADWIASLVAMQEARGGTATDVADAHGNEACADERLVGDSVPDPLRLQN